MDAAPRIVCDEPHWVGAWAAAPGDMGVTLADQTVRVIVTPLHGADENSADEVRVRLSNRFGVEPVTFRNVHIGLQDDGASLIDGSNRTLAFGGSSEVVVPAGGEVVSDATSLSFSAFDRLAVSFFLPAPGGATEHAVGRQTSYLSAVGAGDFAADEGAGGYVETTLARPFLIGVEVLAPAPHSAVATIGDSLTDGAQYDGNLEEVGIDTDQRYPDHLARRLRQEAPHFSVLNLGIGSNRLLSDGIIPRAGPSLLSRLSADLLSRPEVTDVILHIGINDLALRGSLSAEELVLGLAEAVRILHEADREQRLNVLVGTLLPAGGATGGAELLGFLETEERRQAVNEVIRSQTLGDGFIDFDRAVLDPDDPTRLAPEYDGGDGLHLSPEGYARMAEEVDLSRLRGRYCE